MTDAGIIEKIKGDKLEVSPWSSVSKQPPADSKSTGAYISHQIPGHYNLDKQLLDIPFFFIYITPVSPYKSMSLS